VNVAGELERRRPAKDDLAAEGARLGAGFGLEGPCQGAYRARRRSTQWGCGAGLLGWGAILAFVIPEFQHHWGSGWEVGAGVLAAAGAVVMTVAPRSKWDRLYWYPGGVAQRLAAEPEPRILRWADATGVRIVYDTSDDSLILDRCIVDGPGELSIDAGRGYKGGLAAFAREAERVLGDRLLPGLTAACDRGEPVEFGELTITAAGLGVQPARPGREGWWLPWPEVRVVKAHGPGRGLYVHQKPWGRGKRWAGLEGVGNGMLAHRVIEHAAAPYRVPVTLSRE
jgi:hypothetical protein